MAKTVKTKTSATKTAAKKATDTKATAKKTTATKPTTKTTTTEITVSGNKKIATLQKEFNKKFPYIRLGIFYSYARNAVKKGETITNIDGDKTLASVRRADSGGSISISGNKKVKSVEQPPAESTNAPKKARQCANVWPKPVKQKALSKTV